MSMGLFYGKPLDSELYMDRGDFSPVQTHLQKVF